MNILTRGGTNVCFIYISKTVMQLAVAKLLYEENEGARTIKSLEEKIRSDCLVEGEDNRKASSLIGSFRLLIYIDAGHVTSGSIPDTAHLMIFRNTTKDHKFTTTKTHLNFGRLEISVGACNQ